MAKTSSTKKMYNEISTMEEECDMRIMFDRYYILNAEFLDTPKNDIGKIAHILLEQNKKHQPIAVYTFENKISSLFSCLEDGEKHYLDGSHHKIISEYSSILARQERTNVTCSLVEFDTRTQIFAYFATKIHINSLRALIKLSENKIRLFDTNNRTLQELILRLDEECGVVWEDIPKSDRFGIFYKLKLRKRKAVITSFSTTFDARDMRKYVELLFG